jgi:hypothetical protein
MKPTATTNYGLKAGDDETTVPGLGRLTIIKQYEGRNSNGKIMFLCRCSCGVKVDREGQNLARKSTYPKSCGCSRKVFTDRALKESGFSPLAQDFYLGALG